MHTRLGILATLVVAAWAPISAIAQQVQPQSRACENWTSDSKKELKQGDVGVVSSSAMFDYSHRQYPFEALSLWGKNPTDPDKICIRYSIKNMDSEKIEAVVWPDAGMYFVDVGSKKWKEWIRQASPPYPAIAAQSEIKAFQNSPQTVRALLPSAPKHTSSTSVQTYAWSEEAKLGYANYDVRKNMPEVVAALSSAGLGTESVTALGVGVNIGRRLNFVTEFSGDNYSFAHYSSVVQNGNEFVFEEGIKFKQLGSGMQVMSPFALAMESLQERTSSKDIIRFAALIGKYRSVALKLEGGGFYRKITAPISKESDHPALFVVEHPVTVRIKGDTMCMSVTSYSPVPIQVGANYCETASQR